MDLNNLPARLELATFTFEVETESPAGQALRDGGAIEAVKTNRASIKLWAADLKEPLDRGILKVLTSKDSSGVLHHHLVQE